jgi:hypothetical protein
MSGRNSLPEETHHEIRSHRGRGSGRRQDRIAGLYMGDSLGIPTSCTGLPATEKHPEGSCSDHRILNRTVTVTVG